MQTTTRRRRPQETKTNIQLKMKQPSWSLVAAHLFVCGMKVGGEDGGGGHKVAESISNYRLEMYTKPMVYCFPCIVTCSCEISLAIHWWSLLSWGKFFSLFFSFISTYKVSMCDPSGIDLSHIHFIAVYLVHFLFDSVVYSCFHWNFCILFCAFIFMIFTTWIFILFSLLLLLLPWCDHVSSNQLKNNCVKSHLHFSERARALARWIKGTHGGVVLGSKQVAPKYSPPQRLHLKRSMKAAKELCALIFNVNSCDYDNFASIIMIFVYLLLFFCCCCCCYSFPYIHTQHIVQSTRTFACMNLR